MLGERIYGGWLLVPPRCFLVKLLMVQKSGVHQLIWYISHYLQGFRHPRWLVGFLNHQQQGLRCFFLVTQVWRKCSEHVFECAWVRLVVVTKCCLSFFWSYLERWSILSIIFKVETTESSCDFNGIYLDWKKLLIGHIPVAYPRPMYPSTSTIWTSFLFFHSHEYLTLFTCHLWFEKFWRYESSSGLT